LLGLTFKPDTDDLRDAPALDLIEELTRLGARVKAYDPIIPIDYTHPVLSNVTLTPSPETLAKGCDALVLVTDWQFFRTLDYTTLANHMHLPVIVDGRNFLDSETLEQAGFYYVGMGRPTTVGAALSRCPRLASQATSTTASQPVLVSA
jgi:UDPglucose 6-dehydrogenase